MPKRYPYLHFNDFFLELYLKGIYLPWSQIDNIFDEKLDELTKNFDITNAICFCAYLNMISHTNEINEIIFLSKKDLSILNFKPRHNGEGILFHRSNLLYPIAKLIKGDGRGNLLVTGQNSKNTPTKNLYSSLALINNKLGELICNTPVSLRIRDYPTIHSHNIMRDSYVRWLKRYWYTYNQLLEELREDKKKGILSLIKSFEQSAELSLKEYFFGATILFIWFIYSKKFDNHNPGTFYIRKDAFQENSKYITYLEKISLDITSMRQYFHDEEDGNKKKKIDIFYHDLLGFFRYPVLKVNEDTYCILDMRFFIERICSGFIWTNKKRQRSLWGLTGALFC